jgi:AraC family transcriptional regulator, positive regulator of tynA and feaB
MHPSSDFLGTPEFNCERWREALRPDWGRYNPAAPEVKSFAGRACHRRLYGFMAIDITGNARRVERTQRDVRLDHMEHYYAVFQLAGESAVIQNDQVVKLVVGSSALVDSTKPLTYVSEDPQGRWFALQLPRRSLVSHLGFDPQGGLLGRHETVAAQVLFDLFRATDTGQGSAISTVDSYMRLAIYDLIGVLFAPSDPAPVSLHANKLLRRICDIIRERFADPDFGPCEVAAEAGISLRYLQKLFTAQTTTCSHHILSVRLDHAARLLHRRELLNTRQPLSDIAYACGFSDYTNFARQFRRRFGYAPGAHAGR